MLLMGTICVGFFCEWMWGWEVGGVVLTILSAFIFLNVIKPLTPRNPKPWAEMEVPRNTTKVLWECMQ